MHAPELWGGHVVPENIETHDEALPSGTGRRAWRTPVLKRFYASDAEGGQRITDADDQIKS
jgi:hypothetical protein